MACGSISGAVAWRSRPSATTPAGSVAATSHARRAPPASVACARRPGRRGAALALPVGPGLTSVPRCVPLPPAARLPAGLRRARAHGHLLGLDLRGPHDLRHTFATCLEDDGTTTRVIDELMGHAATRRSSWAAEEMSAMGAVYRHTTTEMEARVLKALDIRLAEAVAVVEASG